MTARGPLQVAIRTVYVWSGLILIALYASSAVLHAEVSGLGGMVPYALAIGGTAFVAVCHDVAVRLINAALRPPARTRGVVGLASGAVLGTYVFAASLVALAFSVYGLFTENAVTPAIWLLYLAVSLAVGVATVAAALFEIRRRRAVT